MKTAIKVDKAQTRLEAAARAWILSKAADYDGDTRAVLKDLFYGGCQSGIVGGLCYYSDTIKFYKRHQADINALLKDRLESSGCAVGELLPDWDAADPLALDQGNQNLLAWFGFEEAARELANRSGMEDI
jgi:hypothetical protein